MTEQMISYCGYMCHLCAAQSDDPAVRQRLVDGWRKYLGLQRYTAENVRCVGCRREGPHADISCEARPCAIARGVESCALCDDFPCQKLRPLIGSRDGMLVWTCPRSADLTEEEYNLCMRQFDSMPNLIRELARAGKLQAWVTEEP